ncbi:MAG TPA: hypothetical protein PJ991_13300 [Kiritimatiellia bacterium]|nr:hypothetical protein [Kiritimatiellia bacterium]
MRFILNVVILGLAGYGTYALISPHIPWNKLPETTITPKSNASQSTRKTVGCDTCGGIGKLVDESGAIKVGYTCPICNGQGKKTLPPNTTPCTYCKGLGNVAKSAATGSRRLTSQSCPICNGIGVAAKKD